MVCEAYVIKSSRSSRSSQSSWSSSHLGHLGHHFTKSPFLFNIATELTDGLTNNIRI